MIITNLYEQDNLKLNYTKLITFFYCSKTIAVLTFHTLVNKTKEAIAM